MNTILKFIIFLQYTTPYNISHLFASNVEQHGAICVKDVTVCLRHVPVHHFKQCISRYSLMCKSMKSRSLILNHWYV